MVDALEVYKPFPYVKVLSVVEDAVNGPGGYLRATPASDVAKYFPAAQSVHTAEPVAILYFPAAHAVHAFPAGHVVSVMSTPLSMAVAIAVVASVFRYSSTTKTPAKSAFV